jgi:hypothetical protein
VAFHTRIPEFPFGVAGTCLLIGHRGRVFVITAKHVVRDCPIEQVVIFPAEGSTKGLPIPQYWRVLDETEDADRSDLLIMRAEISPLPKPILAAMRLFRLTPERTTEWFDDRFSSKFFVVGYPKAVNSVDYEVSTIKLAQVLLEGSYVGPGISDGCHEARFLNPLAIPDFDGLSGSPVFSVANVIGPAAAPRFCGIALRGGALGGQIHFLEAELVRHALDKALESEMA